MSEPTILHADARLCRDLTLAVTPDATAMVSDVVVPGRLARDERFEFERYCSRVRAGAPDGRIPFTDVTHLASEEFGPRIPGVLDGFAVHGTTSVVTPVGTRPH